MDYDYLIKTTDGQVSWTRSYRPFRSDPPVEFDGLTHAYNIITAGGFPVLAVQQREALPESVDVIFNQANVIAVAAFPRSG